MTDEMHSVQHLANVHTNRIIIMLVMRNAYTSLTDTRFRVAKPRVREPMVPTSRSLCGIELI